MYYDIWDVLPSIKYFNSNKFMVVIVICENLKI